MTSFDNPLNLPNQGDLSDNPLSIQHKKPQVLVTDASSFIGEHFIEELSSGKQEVLAFFQGYEPKSLARVIPVRAQYQNSNFLLSQLKSVRAVLCLDWCFSDNRSPECLGAEDSLFEESTNLIKAAEKTGLKRFILFSTLTEGLKVTAKHSHFTKKMYQLELLLLNSKIEEKIIIRVPPVFSSKPSEIFEAPLSHSILELMKVPGLYPLLTPSRVVSPVDIQDLKTVAFRAAQFPMVEKTVLINLQTENFVSVKHLFELVAARAGVKYKLALSGFLGRWLQRLILRFVANEMDLNFIDHFQKNEQNFELFSEAANESPSGLADHFQAKVLLPFFRSIEAGLQSKTIEKQRVKGRLMGAIFGHR